MDGVDLINVFSFFEISLILVLSPSIEPPVKFEDGSIARIPSLKPCLTRWIPNDSIKVDLPTPGGPENPIRIDFPGLFNKLDIRFLLFSISDDLEDSTNVIAFAIAALSPLRIPLIKSILYFIYFSQKSTQLLFLQIQ